MQRSLEPKLETRVFQGTTKGTNSGQGREVNYKLEVGFLQDKVLAYRLERSHVVCSTVIYIEQVHEKHISWWGGRS